MVTSFLFSLNYKKVRYKAGGATGLHDVRVSLVWPVSVTSTCGYEFGFLWNKDSLIYIILIIQMFLKWNVVSTSVHRWIRYELRESCKCEFCIICGDFQFLFFIFGFVYFVDLFIVSESTRIEMNRSIWALARDRVSLLMIFKFLSKAQ